MAYTLRQRATAVTELCDEIVRYWGSKDFTGYTNQVVPLGLTEREIIFEHGDIRVDAAAGSALALGVGFAESGVSVAYDADKVVSQTVLRSKNKSITTEYDLNTVDPKVAVDLLQRSDGGGYGPIIPAGSLICLVFTGDPTGLLSNKIHWNLRFRTRKG